MQATVTDKAGRGVTGMRATPPCRKDPDAWLLSENALRRLQPAHIGEAVEAADGCKTWCPLKDVCDKDRPGRYDGRVVQAGKIYEPEVDAWLELDDWLNLTRYHRCEICGTPTRKTYCSTSCSMTAYHQDVKAAAAADISPNCPSTTVHNTASAFQKAGCRCDEARRQYEAMMRRSYARQKHQPRRYADTTLIRALHAAGRTNPQIATELNLHPDTVQKHLRAVAPQRSLDESIAAVVKLTAEGLSKAEIGQRLGLHPRTIQDYRARARAAAEQQQAVA